MYYPWFPFGGTEALRGPGRKWKNQESPVVSPPLHSPSQRLWFWIALAEASLRSLPPPTPGVRWALPHCHPQLPGHQRLGKSSVLFSGSCGAGSQPLQKEFCLFFSFPFFYEVRLISAPNINLLCHFRGRWRMSTEMDFHACLSLVSPVFSGSPLGGDGGSGRTSLPSRSHSCRPPPRPPPLQPPAGARVFHLCYVGCSLCLDDHLHFMSARHAALTLTGSQTVAAFLIAATEETEA